MSDFTEEINARECAEKNSLERETADGQCAKNSLERETADGQCAKNSLERETADGQCAKNSLEQGAANEISTPCERKKLRSAEEKRALANRLARVEGQIRGIEGMVERDAYCADILIQVSAVSAALASFSKELLGEHIRTCVAEDVKNGNGEKLDELISLLGKMLK